MLAEIATVIAPLFVCAGIGFAWARAGRGFDTQMVGLLVGNVALPCLVFSTMTKLDVSPDIFARMAGSYLVALAAFATVGLGVLRASGLDVRIYGPPMVFSNNGNMGLPVCLFAFGDAGLALAICVFLANSVLSYTIGLGTFAGRLSFRSVTHNALVYTLVVALVFMAYGIVPPRWLANTAALMGGITIPFMLVALGVAVAKLAVADLPRTLALALVRQASGFAIALTVAALLGLEGAERGVLILQFSMPTAVVNYLFAQRHDRRPEQVASLVVVTTAVSYAMLPLVLLVVLPGA